MDSDSYNKIRYEIVPPVFLVVFTALAQILVGIGNPDLGFSLFSLFSIGSVFAWKIVILFYLWAFISLKVRNPAQVVGVSIILGGKSQFSFTVHSSLQRPK